MQRSHPVTIQMPRSCIDPATTSATCAASIRFAERMREDQPVDVRGSALARNAYFAAFTPKKYRLTGATMNENHNATRTPRATSFTTSVSTK